VHTALNLLEQLGAVLRQFKLEDSFGNAVTDNASKNAACLALLGEELAINTSKCHVRCIGHVINLVAQQILFGQDAESFKELVTNVIAIEVELASWRRKGPISKLHNLIRYICSSESRRALFEKVQKE
jgi:hypothetical protein